MLGYMDNMFYNAKSFNQSLNNWNVSNVTNMDHFFDLHMYLINK